MAYKNIQSLASGETKYHSHRERIPCTLQTLLSYIIEALFAKTQGWVQLNRNPIILEVFNSKALHLILCLYGSLSWFVKLKRHSIPLPGKYQV